MLQDATVLGTDEAIRALNQRLAPTPEAAIALRDLVRNGRARVLLGEQEGRSILYVALEQPDDIQGYYVCEPEGLRRVND
jgi:hypothetical protein